jgi:dihydrofolate reductase
MSGPSVVLVAALAQNRVIGKDGALPWRLPDDLQHFKALTVGKPVIMGRKTYASIGRPLPHRTNVIVSRTSGPIEGCIVVASPEAALAACDAEVVSVIGGGEIYRAFLPLAEVLELTLIDGEIEGDAFFPAYRDAFVEIDRTEHPIDERHALPFAFTRWVPRA